MRDDLPTIGILGGTGALGTGLAWRWAKAGFRLIIALARTGPRPDGVWVV